MTITDLLPIDNRKSFYGKAKVIFSDNGTQTLMSYNTNIIRKEVDGSLSRLYDEWSLTTGRHIKAFCGLDKSQFFKLPLVHV